MQYIRRHGESTVARRREKVNGDSSAARKLSGKDKINLIVTASAAIGVNMLVVVVLMGRKTTHVHGIVVDVYPAAKEFSMSRDDYAAPMRVSLRSTDFEINQVGFERGTHINLLYRNNLFGPKQAVRIELVDAAERAKVESNVHGRN